MLYFWPFGGDKQLVSTKLEHLTCLLQIYMLFPFQNSYFKLTFFCIKTQSSRPLNVIDRVAGHGSMKI